jgi:DNA-binding NarL/FixJ family response regulator
MEREVAPTGTHDARPTGVLVVDGHAVVREGLRRIVSFREDLVVVGEAAGSDDALDLIARRRPDVIVIADDLPGSGGLATSLQIADRHPAVGIVMLVGQLDPDGVRTAWAHGARAVLGRDASSADILAAIVAVAGGASFTDPRIAPGTDDELTVPNRISLTGREREILQLLADGYTNREVGARLALGSETIKTHVAHILSKLDAAQRSQAVAIGIREGLIR